MWSILISNYRKVSMYNHALYFLRLKFYDYSKPFGNMAKWHSFQVLKMNLNFFMDRPLHQSWTENCNSVCSVHLLNNCTLIFKKIIYRKINEIPGNVKVNWPFLPLFVRLLYFEKWFFVPCGNAQSQLNISIKDVTSVH